MSFYGFKRYFSSMSYVLPLNVLCRCFSRVLLGFFKRFRWCAFFILFFTSSVVLLRLVGLFRTLTIIFCDSRGSLWGVVGFSYGNHYVFTTTSCNDDLPPPLQQVMQCLSNSLSQEFLHLLVFPAFTTRIFFFLIFYTFIYQLIHFSM